jgi:hypothetical protein
MPVMSFDTFWENGFTAAYQHFEAFAGVVIGAVSRTAAAATGRILPNIRCSCVVRGPLRIGFSPL